MKRFEFRLKRLARVRQVQEEQARARWLSAEMEARELEARVSKAQAQIAEALVHLRQAQAAPFVDPRSVLGSRSSIELMEDGRRRLSLQARSARKRADQEKLPWTSVRAELEGLARLEEKEHEQHRLEVERSEAVELDEIAAERQRRRGSHDL